MVCIAEEFPVEADNPKVTNSGKKWLKSTFVERNCLIGTLYPKTTEENTQIMRNRIVTNSSFISFPFLNSNINIP